MAGAVLISKGNVWTVGSHFFHPLMEMMKSEYLAAGYPHEDYEAQFASLDQGFEHIAVDDPISYTRCVLICQMLMMKINNETISTTLNRVALKSCLEGFLVQLKADAKYSKFDSLDDQS